MLVDGFAKQQKQDKSPLRPKQEQEQQDLRQLRAEKSTQTVDEQQQRSFSGASSVTSWGESGGEGPEEEEDGAGIYVEEVDGSDNGSDGEVPELLSPRTVSRMKRAEQEQKKEEETGLLAAIKKAYRVSFAASDSALEKALPKSAKLDSDQPQVGN